MPAALIIVLLVFLVMYPPLAAIAAIALWMLTRGAEA